VDTRRSLIEKVPHALRLSIAERTGTLRASSDTAAAGDGDDLLKDAADQHTE